MATTVAHCRGGRMSRRTAVKEDSDQEMDEHSSDNEDTDTSSASDDDSSSGE